MTRITEAQAAQHPDAIAGKAALEARLERLSPAERAAFYRAIRLCFASGCSGAPGEHRAR
ncbi:hypothetical protein FV218_12505 [Methylobacterium sp. WL69]|jgi:hypothetical protein|nr:hypothetical protein FV218_12505 [Methylobacterium sp. WL69]